MNDDLREFGLVAVLVSLEPKLGIQVQRVFVVNADPNDPGRPNEAELKARVNDWLEGKR